MGSGGRPRARTGAKERFPPGTRGEFKGLLWPRLGTRARRRGPEEGRGEEARPVRARVPGERWPFVRQLPWNPALRTALLFLPFFMLESTSSGRERTVNHRQLP